MNQRATASGRIIFDEDGMTVTAHSQAYMIGRPANGVIIASVVNFPVIDANKPGVLTAMGAAQKRVKALARAMIDIGY